MKTAIDMLRRIWFPLLAAGIVMPLVFSCSSQRIRDRNDEVILNREEDSYNLYRRGGGGSRGRIPSFPSAAAGRDTAYFDVSLLRGVRQISLDDPDVNDAYGLVALSWAENPPVLRFYQRFFNQRAVAFTCPIDLENSRLVVEDELTRTRAVLVSLRQGTFMPWVVADDYEVFKITVVEDRRSGAWRLTGIAKLTDDREDSIQPVFNRRGDGIAWVQLTDDGRPSLWCMDADGKNRRMVCENGSLPFFLPDSDALIFVHDSGKGRDFFVYEPNKNTISPAADFQVGVACRSLPYSRIKRNYLLIENFRRGKAAKISPESVYMTFEQTLQLGLRSAPEIRRDYYDYESAMAGTAENLWDIGPDVAATAYYSAANYILVRDTANSINVGDHINTQDFLRLIGGLQVPVIPNIPLRQAIYARDSWNAEAARTRFYKTVNDYVARLISIHFDYLEKRMCIESFQHMVKIARQRDQEFTRQLKEDVTIPERQMFAASALLASRNDLDDEVESLIGSQLQLAGMLGLNPVKGLELELPEADRLLDRRFEVPGVAWFQAQAQISHPDIQQLNFMLLRAAAIRDMGPPSTRTNGVSISASYGFGLLKWSDAIDDFLLLGASYVKPLRLPKVYDSYYDNWTGVINSLRQEKYRLQAELKSSVHRAWREVAVQEGQIKTWSKRVEMRRERLRIARICRSYGSSDFQREQVKFLLANYDDVYSNALSYYEDAVRLRRMQCEYFRRVARLYAASGCSLKLIPGALTLLQPGTPPPREARGVYLWRSVEVVADKSRREAFMAYCRRHGINKVYCYVSRTREKEFYLERYRLEFSYLLELCHREGIEVVALMGEPDWLEDGARSEIAALLRVYRQFNESCENDGMVPFAGVKLDVEPHSLPDWKTRQQELCRRYLGLLREVRGAVGREHLSVDVSYQYDLIRLGSERKDFVTAIATEVSLMTVMAYLNRAELIERKMLPFLQRRLDCRFEAAVETASLPESYVSFYGRSWSELDQVLARCGEVFRKYADFGGFIIHDYTNSSKLKP